MKQRTPEEVFDRYGPGTLKTALNIANKFDIKEDEMKKVYNKKGIGKDASKKTALKQIKKYGMPIFSQKRGGWQFDTVVPKNHKAGGKYYLWFVNTNTKFSRAYEMNDKSSDEVYRVMNMFIDDNKKRGFDMTQLTCDADPAYTDPKVLDLLQKNNINLKTTNKESKHALGVVNRNIKTIRDRIANTRGLKEGSLGNMSKEQINQKLSGWNNEPRVDGKTPLEMTSKDGEDAELDLIATKMNIADEKREQALKGIKVGQVVRRFNPDSLSKQKEHAQKNLDMYKWKIHDIDKASGKIWLGGDDPKQGLVQVPRFQVLTDKSYVRNTEMVPSIHPDLKKKVVDIESDKPGYYNVQYEDGTSGKRTVRQIRGTQPLNPLKVEVDYYLKKMNNEQPKMKTRRGGQVFTNLPPKVRDLLERKIKT